MKTFLGTGVVFAAFALSILSSGCATNAADDDADDEAVAIAEEQNLTVGGDWKCSGSENKSDFGTGGASVRTVRAAAHPAAGFDRFVIELKRGGNPNNFIIQRQAEPVFMDTAERTYRLKGDDGLAVIFLGETMEPAGGPKRLQIAGGVGILEARETEDFESNVEWGLGTKKNACFKSFTLANPPRIVVDVKR